MDCVTIMRKWSNFIVVKSSSAGTLGYLEEMRDDKVGQVMTWMQSRIRTFLQLKEFKRLQEQR